MNGETARTRPEGADVTNVFSTIYDKCHVRSRLELALVVVRPELLSRERGITRCMRTFAERASTRPAPGWMYSFGAVLVAR
jgi:hypothetical protein